MTEQITQPDDEQRRQAVLERMTKANADAGMGDHLPSPITRMGRVGGNIHFVVEVEPVPAEPNQTTFGANS
jgi:hypothetical protein